MGIERIAAVMQGTNDNYQVDSILEIINHSKELTKNDNENLISSHRVIADHLRSSCFLIADGVLPSNEGRGYVLRRIMRRAMRHVHILNYNDLLMHKLAPTLISNMKMSYPELERAESLINETLKYEEQRFRDLLSRGIKQLDTMIDNLNGKTILTGQSAFKLYDTYGFPIDLTQDILRNKKIEVDIDDFRKCLEDQKEKARSNWTGSGGTATDKIWFELNKSLSPTEFLGYTSEKTEGSIISIIKEGVLVDSLHSGDNGSLILNQTVFYAESGGQIGDTGTIQADNFEFEVSDTQKKGNLFVHHGKVIRGDINKGTGAHLSINSARRSSCKTYHSATHILHQALREVLGDHVTQKGSLVSFDKLRFDFSHHKSLSESEISK